MRIHITGASGTGTTTLGQALAAVLNLVHLDGDAYYWLPTQPPFKVKRQAVERHAALRSDLHKIPDLVLSGSIVGWGADLEDAFDLVVFLYVIAELRVERLRNREIQRCGVADPEFLEWAQQYDEGPREGRSLAKHSVWLSERACPVLRLEGDLSVAERIRRICQALPNASLGARPSLGY
ncbi:MAG: AAA family ATPase [Betaproteobacteria bacterium]